MVGGEIVGIWSTIKNLFRKGGAKLGMVKSLVKITDDERIEMPASEYKRIDRDFRYYRNDFDPVYRTIQGRKHKHKIHALNMTKTCARRIASIVFNEKCKISFNDDKLNSFIDDVLNKNDFYNQFETNLEKGVAAGGFAMRPYVDNDEIKISWIRANQFYPLRSNTNDIAECAIASKTIRVENDQMIYYTLLEFHQWDNDAYHITNELYRSDNVNEVGVQVPLNTIYENLEEQVVINGLTAPLFAYFHTPGANNINLESPLGVGIVDNAKSVLDDINLINDMYYEEIKLGKRRIIVPAQMLRYDEQHRPYFDTEDATYEGFDIDDPSSMKITDNTVDIRTEQFNDAMDTAIKKLEIQLGLSTGTFSKADGGIQTATQVVSNNSMTYQTRSSYLTMVEKAIKQLMIAIIQLAETPEFFSDGKARIDFDLSKDLDIDVYFDDGVFVNKDQQLDEDLKVFMAKAMPVQEFLKRNYGLSDDEVKQWMAEMPQNNPKPSEDEMNFGDA